MLFAALAALGLLAFFVLRSRSKTSHETERESTPALDAWLTDALEIELAEGVLGMAASTPEERRSLRQTLRGEPDADVVSRVEERVRAVELEFQKYSHESDCQATVHVRYEDGRTGTSTRRLALTEVPNAVREEFEQRAITRVFRAWPLPWQRATAL